MKSNIAMKILSAPEQMHIIKSPDEALECLKLIKSNFAQTKNDLHELGLLGDHIEIMAPIVKELAYA